MSRTKDTDKERIAGLKAEAVKHMRRSAPRWVDLAAMLMIHEDTLIIWRKNDADFSDKLAKAKLEYREDLIASVRVQKGGDWNLLSTQFKDEFSTRTEHTGADGKELIIALTEIKKKYSE